MKDIGRFAVYLIVSAIVAAIWYGLFSVAFNGIDQINAWANNLDPIKEFLGKINPEFERHGAGYLFCTILGLVIAKFIVYSKS